MMKPVKAHPQMMATDVSDMFVIARTGVDTEEATPRRLAERAMDLFIGIPCGV
jgi:hypothetical protein